MQANEKNQSIDQGEISDGLLVCQILPEPESFRTADYFRGLPQSCTSCALNFSDFRVLVADDHPLSVLFARRLLQKIGFERVEEARSGTEALEKFINEGKYDLVLLDCQMPEMDGYEACRRIRQAEQRSHMKRTPIVAMSASTMEENRKACLQAGMDDYVSKPVIPDVLYDILDYWLISKSAQQEITPAEVATKSFPVPQAEPSAAPVNMALLSLFTEGVPAQEKIMSDIFISSGENSLRLLAQFALTDEAAEQWEEEAHKLKGSSAQIGAEHLAQLCRMAEAGGQGAPEEKKNILGKIKTEFSKVKEFFTQRQDTKNATERRIVEMVFKKGEGNASS